MLFRSSKYISQYIPGGISQLDYYATGYNGIIGQGAFGYQLYQKLYYAGSDCNYFGFYSPAVGLYQCSTPDPTSTIFYSKYVSGTCPSCVGVIYIEFNQLDDLSVYYDKYYEALSHPDNWYYSACTGSGGQTFNGGGLSGPFSGGTWTGATTSPFDNTDYRYYRHLWLAIPNASGSTNCGQNSEGGGGGFVSNYSGLQGFAVHPSATVSTGITGSNYYLQIIKIGRAHV